MKGIVILSALLLSLILFSGSASAYVSLTFSSSTSPATIGPGSKASLLLTISNTGTDFAGSPQLQVKSSNYVSADTPLFNLPTINAGGSTQITIPITVSPSAPEGTVVLPFTVSYNVGNNAGSVSADNSATITITKRTLLQVVDVTYSKNQIQRGDTFTMTITLQNVGTGQVKDLTVSLRNFSVPVVPTSSDTEKYVGTLSSGQTVDVSFDLTANTDASTITYSIPVSLNYYDDQGTLNSNTKYVGLKVVGIPDFVIAIDQTQNMFVGSQGKLTLDVANTGTGTAQYLAAYATSSDGSIQPSTVYIGNLNPDDTNTLSMDVTPLHAGKYNLNLELKYKDSYNQDFSKSYQLSFNVTQAPIQIPLQVQIVIIVIVLAIAYWKRNFLMKLLKRKAK